MVAEEVMTACPVVVDAYESIGCARAKLREADVRHLPVLDRGVLVGMISDRDIPVFDLAADLLLESRHALGQPAASAMSNNLVVGHPHSELGTIIDLMLKHKIGALPIVAPGSRELLGIISYVDLLKAARERI